MRTWNISRAPLCAAALLLCAIGSAQWPARWHPTAATDDDAECVAVDRRGNVFVAGRTKFFSGGTDWDYGIVKYSPSGAKIWETHYDGTATADDIPTALEVDESGFIYVAGTSAGSGS